MVLEMSEELRIRIKIESIILEQLYRSSVSKPVGDLFCVIKFSVLVHESVEVLKVVANETERAYFILPSG